MIEREAMSCPTWRRSSTSGRTASRQPGVKLGVRAGEGRLRGGVGERRERLRSRASETE